MERVPAEPSYEVKPSFLLLGLLKGVDGHSGQAAVSIALSLVIFSMEKSGSKLVIGKGCGITCLNIFCDGSMSAEVCLGVAVHTHAIPSLLALALDFHAFLLEVLFVVPDSGADDAAHGEQQSEGRGPDRDEQEVEAVEETDADCVLGQDDVLAQQQAVDTRDQTVRGVHQGVHRGVQAGEGCGHLGREGAQTGDDAVHVGLHSRIVPGLHGGDTVTGVGPRDVPGGVHVGDVVLQVHDAGPSQSGVPGGKVSSDLCGNTRSCSIASEDAVKVEAPDRAGGEHKGGAGLNRGSRSTRDIGSGQGVRAGHQTISVEVGVGAGVVLGSVGDRLEDVQGGRLVGDVVPLGGFVVREGVRDVGEGVRQVRRVVGAVRVRGVHRGHDAVDVRVDRRGH